MPPENYKTWCLEFKNTTNQNIKRGEVLDYIKNAVDARANPVDLKNADLCFLVEVHRDLLLIGVVPRYKELKKYNLQQLVKEGGPEEEDEEPRRVVKITDLIGKR